MREVTLVFCLDKPANTVLLGVKKRGFGAGHVVGIGGGLEPGESAVQAAVRELWEETRVQAKLEDLRAMGSLEFVFEGRPAWHMRAALFTTARWSGEAQETDEIAPVWCDLDALPLERMWADVPLWLPRVLRGGKLEARCVYAPDGVSVASFAHLEL
jgi:8-oxo-dGTP diphosphatase